jgi:hypothetical protein
MPSAVTTPETAQLRARSQITDSPPEDVEADRRRRLGRIRKRILSEAAVRLVLLALLWAIAGYALGPELAPYRLRLAGLMLLFVSVPDLFYKLSHFAEARRSVKQRDSDDVMTHLVSDLETMQTEFAHSGELLLEVISGVDQNYSDTATRLSEILGHIQFQDVMRQRMEHVQSSLEEMRDHLLRLDQLADSPGWDGRSDESFKSILASQVKRHTMVSQTRTHMAVAGGDLGQDHSRPSIELF